MLFRYIIVKPVRQIYSAYSTSARLRWKRLPWCAS